MTLRVWCSAAAASTWYLMGGGRKRGLEESSGLVWPRLSDLPWSNPAAIKHQTRILTAWCSPALNHAGCLVRCGGYFGIHGMFNAAGWQLLRSQARDYFFFPFFVILRQFAKYFYVSSGNSFACMHVFHQSHASLHTTRINRRHTVTYKQVSFNKSPTHSPVYASNPNPAPLKLSASLLEVRA